MNTPFHAMLDELRKVLDGAVLSEETQPGLYRAHLQLDGKEFVLVLTATDLEDAARQDVQPE